LRNQQIQKLYNEYNFDKEKIKPQDPQQPEKVEQPKTENLPLAGPSDKTTKITTIN
jgi:hypothetical protein